MALYVPTQAAAETFVDSDHSAAGHRPSTSYPHLTPDAAAVAALNADERIERILSLKWIGYGRAAEILTALEKLIRHPKVHRMPGALIYGETNNGKTAIAQRFLEMHPPVNDPRDDCAHIPRCTCKRRRQPMIAAYLVEYLQNWMPRLHVAPCGLINCNIRLSNSLRWCPHKSYWLTKFNMSTQRPTNKNEAASRN